MFRTWQEVSRFDCCKINGSSVARWKGDEMVEALKDKGTSEVLKKLREMKKSAQDKKIAGICGGFGEFTPLPSWLWRVVFLTSLFVGGVGLIAYIILWICMPSAKTDP
jgi:phage shock protein PspC (stress-responsive transcriptional regulator)